MAKPRFYDPQAIRPHPRVKHRPLDSKTDEYVGQGEDLIEAGVVKSDMLPPRVSWSWRPADVAREGRESVNHLPGYVTVTKVPERGFRVVLTVSSEEQAARFQALDEKQAQAKAQRAAMQEASAHQKSAEAAQAATEPDPDLFRRMALVHCGGMLRSIIETGYAGCTFEARERQEMLELAEELHELMVSAPIAKARKRGHLMLAWSA